MTVTMNFRLGHTCLSQGDWSEKGNRLINLSPQASLGGMSPGATPVFFFVKQMFALNITYGLKAFPADESNTQVGSTAISQS